MFGLGLKGGSPRIRRSLEVAHLPSMTLRPIHHQTQILYKLVLLADELAFTLAYKYFFK